MDNIVFKDCEYRFTENNELYCKNKTGTDITCDNCECQEKTVFNDKALSRKWSN